MEFRVNIDLENNAFTSAPEKAVAKILKEIGDRIKKGYVFGKVMDVNGNSVGEFEFTTD